MVGLIMALDYEPDGSPQAVYDLFPKHRVKIDDGEIQQEIEFVFVSSRFLEDYAQGSTLGYVEGENVFISKTLHPAQVPFVAMYLYFSELNGEKLSALGQPALSSLYSTEIRRIFLNVSIAYAGQYLRPKEMKDFLERFKAETYLRGVVLDLDEVITHAEQKFGLAERGDVSALVRREERSLDHYTGQMGEYLRAFENHRAVRRSRSLAGLVQAHPGLGRTFQGDIARCEPSYTLIMGDEELQEYLPAIVDLLERLESLASEKRVDGPQIIAALDRLGSKLAYFCSGDIVSRRPPLRSLPRREYPVEYRLLPPDHDVIEITDGFSQSFFASLRRRLLCRIGEQVRTIEAALTGDAEDETPIITLAAGRLREMILGAHSADLETRALIPGTGQALPIGAVTELSVAATNLSLVLTGADQSLRDTHQLIGIRQDLLANGTATTDLDEQLLVTAGNLKNPNSIPEKLEK